MVFEVTEGLNVLSIGLNGLGSYFKFIRPISLVWNDNRGSVGRYMCLLPLSKDERAELYEKITLNLNEDFTDRINELYQILNPLFRLLANGEYHLSFNNGKIKRESTIFSGDGTVRTYKPSWYVQYADVVDLSKTDQLIANHKKYIKDNNLESYNIQVIEHTTTNFYEWQNDPYLATKPASEIDLERVKHFEEKIRSGERPFAIMLDASFYPEDINSEYFILDGHHKLQAYQNLNTQPPIAVISRIYKNSYELEFDVEKLAELLYPWQIRHILEHWEEKDSLLPKLLANPHSILHKFIKNGLVIEYHDNGRKKHEAFYINDRVDGISKGWYKNGQLKYLHSYDKGVRIGTWQDFYPNGKIEYIQPFNSNGQYHGHLVSYYENEKVRWEKYFDNGRPVDGFSHFSYSENGSKEGELKYLNGQLVERKNWRGLNIINHEIYNFETREYEKQDTDSINKKADKKFRIIVLLSLITFWILLILYFFSLT